MILLLQHIQVTKTNKSMETKMTERQEILFEMKKKKPYRAFLAACMWGGFGLYYTGKPIIASILTICTLYNILGAVVTLFKVDLVNCVEHLLWFTGFWIFSILIAVPLAKDTNNNIKREIIKNNK